ncbi:MAG: hypothetical protein ACTJLK_02265 [Anaplasma sp.]
MNSVMSFVMKNDGPNFVIGRPKNAVFRSPKEILLSLVVVIAFVAFSPVIISVLGVLALVILSAWLFVFCCDFVRGRNVEYALTWGVNRDLNAPPTYDEAAEVYRCALRGETALLGPAPGEQPPSYEASVQGNDGATPSGDGNVAENGSVRGEANAAAGNGSSELTQQPENEPLGQVPSSKIETETDSCPTTATACRKSATP